MPASISGSFGEWMRLLPHDSPVPPTEASISSRPRPMDANESPAAPKNPSIPARAIATTSRGVAIPFAIEPVT